MNNRLTPARLLRQGYYCVVVGDTRCPSLGLYKTRLEAERVAREHRADRPWLSELAMTTERIWITERIPRSSRAVPTAAPAERVHTSSEAANGGRRA
ncbi:MAG: hypothetical protein RJA99_4265 [Pseudomonadota bacterium]